MRFYGINENDSVWLNAAEIYLKIINCKNKKHRVLTAFLSFIAM